MPLTSYSFRPLEKISLVNHSCNNALKIKTVICNMPHQKYTNSKLLTNVCAFKCLHIYVLGIYKYADFYLEDFCLLNGKHLGKLYIIFEF